MIGLAQNGSAACLVSGHDCAAFSVANLATVATGPASNRRRSSPGPGLSRPLWTLRISGQEIPGRWVIMDQEFRQAL